MLFWILLLLLIIIAYALLIVWALPGIVLRSNYSVTHPSDRGLKKYKWNDSDHAIVYEPSLAARKYITQYVLARRNGKKTIRCKVAQSVAYIDFDIVLFDAHGKSFLAIHSMDILGADGLTDETELPAETAYVSVIVRQVNETVVQDAHATAVSTSRLVGFGILALLISIGFAVLILFAFSHGFGGLFRETFAEKMISTGWIFVFSTLISAACITGACYTLYLRNSKR